MTKSGSIRYVPIVAFAYNRIDKIIGCLKSLEQNPEAREIYIYIYTAMELRITKDFLKYRKPGMNFMSMKKIVPLQALP